MSVTMVLIPVAIAAAGTLFVKVEPLESDLIIFKTKMKNALILQKAVINLGYQPHILNRIQMEIKHEDMHINFQKNEDNTIQATFSENISQKHAEAYIAEIYDEYTTLVQQQTYEKLLENIKNRNLNLESEEVTKDNSIVLTLTVQE
ncbi:MAG: hypothetical protein ABFD07_18370 [Methanobacterium sp.]